MEETFNIKLTIGGKPYSLNIKRVDEEKYRRAEREINGLVSLFRGKFAAQDSDYLTMAALQLAVQKIGIELSRSLGEDIDALKELEKQVDLHLNRV